MELEEDEEIKDISSEDSLTSIYPVSEIQAHTDSVCTVNFHPTSPDTYASGGVDDTGFLYIGQDIKILSGHTDSIVVVVFSNCGEYLAVGSMDGNVSVWGTQNGDSISRFQGPTEEVLSVSWHPKLPSICVLSSDASVWVWHMRKNSPVAVIYGHPLNTAKFGPVGRYIYAGGKDGSVKVWDMKTENFESSPPCCTIQGKDLHTDEVICIDMHANGVIVSGSKDGYISLVNINSKKVIWKIQICEESIESVEFCKDMMWFLVGTMNGDLRVYECDNLSSRFHVQIGTGVVKAVWVRMEIYVCGLEGFLECFDGRDGERIKKYLGSQETILDFDIKQ
jgi:WD40 repeat protein